MTSTLTYDAAVANVDDLRRRADAHRAARDRTPRWARPRLAWWRGA
jgi:hypothetical protein